MRAAPDFSPEIFPYCLAHNIPTQTRVRSCLHVITPAFREYFGLLWNVEMQAYE